MTKETEVEAKKPVMASRDAEETEVVETVDIDPPEPETRPDIEDVIATSDDPRAEIYKRHTEKRQAEIDNSDPLQDGYLDENDEEGAEKAKEAVETDGSPDIIDEEPGQTDTPTDSVEMVTVKILGDFREVPKSKVDAAGGIENYQIRIAAQEQMERNAHERRALEARQAALDERERRLAARQAEVPATDPQKGQTNPDRSTQSDGQSLQEMARRYQEAVYDDDAEAPSILADMVSRAASTGQSFDRDEFRRQVKEEVLAEQRQAKIVKASRNLIAEHPELNERDTKFDPRMFNAIDSETVQVEREHPEWEPEEIVKEAYERIRRWKGMPKSETMSNKQAEKRAMTRPKAGTARYQPPPPPPRQTNSDYVQAERKRRGLE